ncbi:MAG: transposase [Thermodesulfobacteriota bacterium]|jgi:REP element-mobilizing transposase RayT|nr:transposase [Thermodesulfobacteriota bacterium]
MPRTARLDIPGLTYHVIARGVNRRELFLDDDDRRKFLSRFSDLLTETQTQCFAWALMSNHFHLLLRPGQAGLAHLMRRLLTSYAIYFNRRHDRSGHLFQNRYRSIVCDEDAYLHELVRYIHLNPLRAGVVKALSELGDYPWCGHAVVMGKKTLAGQAVHEVLELFAKNEAQGRSRYHSFIADGLDLDVREKITTSRSARQGEPFPDPLILGDEGFGERLQTLYQRELRAKMKIPVNEIVKRVCGEYKIEAGELVRNTRTAKIAEVRAVICYLAVRIVGYSGVVVGRYVNLERAGVSRAAVRGERIVKSLPQLLRLVDE